MPIMQSLWMNSFKYSDGFCVSFLRQQLVCSSMLVAHTCVASLSWSLVVDYVCGVHCKHSIGYGNQFSCTWTNLLLNCLQVLDKSFCWSWSFRCWGWLVKLTTSRPFWFCISGWLGAMGLFCGCALFWNHLAAFWAFPQIPFVVHWLVAPFFGWVILVLHPPLPFESPCAFALAFLGISVLFLRPDRIEKVFNTPYNWICPPLIDWQSFKVTDLLKKEWQRRKQNQKTSLPCQKQFTLSHIFVLQDIHAFGFSSLQYSFTTSKHNCIPLLIRCLLKRLNSSSFIRSRKEKSAN